jgi:hypothetical protein
MEVQYEENNNNHIETGLKHGQFYIYQKNKKNQDNKIIVNPLTQEEIADKWIQVLPKVRKNSTIHHFSLYLSQLPHHLWNQLRVDNMNPDSYIKIKDRIYTYTVKMSKHDNEIWKLYMLVKSNKQNIDEIAQQFKVLQNARVKGWLMILAHRLIYPQ